MDEIVSLYNKLEFKLFDDPYGNAFKSKKGNPVKYFDFKKNINLLKELKEEKSKKVLFFLTLNSLTYFIPLEFPDGEIYGFLLRSINSKNFYNYKLRDCFPMVYGLYDFSSYKMNQKIFLVEGVKEAQTFKLFYPYVIAYMTSQPSKKLFEYLKTISNNLVFVPDNDSVGKELNNMKKYSKYSKYFCQSSKDFGDYWNKNEKHYLDEVKNILRMENVL